MSNAELFTKTRNVASKRWLAASFNDVEWVLLKDENGKVLKYECYWAEPSQLILICTLEDGKHRLVYLTPEEEERIVGVEKYPEDEEDGGVS